MDILKIAAIGIVGVIISSLLKKDKPEFSLLVTLATGMILLVLLLSSMTSVVTAFDDLISKTGVNPSLFAGILKIIGIGYLTEYGANLCADYGSNSISNKIQIAGKITIFLMSLPIIKSLVEAVSSLV